MRPAVKPNQAINFHNGLKKKDTIKSFQRLLMAKKSRFETKGQLISECLFEKIVWTKIPTKNLIDSAQQV